MFRTAHRLRRYRAEHGAYPPEADFDAPPDPWSKGFLQYQRVGDGFALWSLRTDAAGEWITWLWDADELPEPIRPPPSPSNEVDWSEGD